MKSNTAHDPFLEYIESIQHHFTGGTLPSEAEIIRIGKHLKQLVSETEIDEHQEVYTTPEPPNDEEKIHDLLIALKETNEYIQDCNCPTLLTGLKQDKRRIQNRLSYYKRKCGLIGVSNYYLLYG